MTDVKFSKFPLWEQNRHTHRQGQCHMKRKGEVERCIYMPGNTKGWQQATRSLMPWSWAFSFQNHATTHFCRLSHPVCGALLWPPSETHIHGVLWLTYVHSIKKRTLSLTLPLKEEEKEEREEKEEGKKRRAKMCLDGSWLQLEKLPLSKRGFTSVFNSFMSGTYYILCLHLKNQ